MPKTLQGLIAATHTPFAADGSLNLDIVERQAAHLLANGVSSAFICGSTGESHSLSLDERLRVAARWFEVAKGTPLSVVVHVGANCLADARALAAQAEQLGAAAIAAVAPSYFKPATIELLVDCCADIAAAAPSTPFYYYDIPTMTGVHLPAADFLEQAADRIPNLAGAKFTNVDLVGYQRCRAAVGGKFEILWGFDEMLLAALALGARGAVGSSYNLAAPLYHRIIDAYQRRDMLAAQRDQLRSVELIRTLVKRGFMASTKAMMTMLGVDVGPPRLPNARLSADEFAELRREIAEQGFLP